MTTLRSRWRRFAGHPRAIPLLLAVLIAAVGAQVALVSTVPSWANDEPAHVGYVAALAEGRLPTIETDIVDDPARFPLTAEELRGRDEEHGDIWTANHPPLVPLAMVPVWWALSDVNQSGMVITMRIANSLGFALWLFLVGVFALELVPRRPAVGALAVVVAAAPTLVFRAGFFQNDGWASASAMVLLLATARMLRSGSNRARVAVAVAAGVVAAGTRAQGALLVALCAGALLLVVVRREGRRRGLGVAALVGGVPAAAWSWFYLRNLRLYGDVTGQQALLEKFDRPTAGLGEILTSRTLAEPTFAAGIVLVAAIVLVPVAAIRSVRRHGVRVDPVWALLLVHAVLTLLSLVDFLRSGGWFHDRYVMQVMPLLSTATAIGMLEVARRGRPEPADGPAAQHRDWRGATAWSAVLLVWLAVALAVIERRHVFSRQEFSPVDGAVPDVLVAVAVVVGAMVVAVGAHRARSLGPLLAAARASATRRPAPRTSIRSAEGTVGRRG